ncbi:ubiquinol oxidase subunit II [Muricoccus pecuniae]|uniref:Ubiquinol oxidase subunit 2 n=1 Tax=Muricoccus pecuniae TaxID=693023 RepID=A0A840Y8X8_9PROT|nr:ubiquinol oxidase subunit II [Roseomonas pecuniae]MBB5696616.1 cytochrome o ubiquinol oxidase subunit 2 [Roseomonas pecuniae]
MREQTTAVARRLARAGTIPLLLTLAGCDMVVMNPTGDIAVQQRDLILIATGLMLLIIVPVMVLTVLFAWRYRAGNPRANYDPKFDHSTSLELVIWSCPLLIIICLGAITWSSTHLLDPFRPLDRIAPGRPVPPGTRPLEVQVVAMDWKWLFIYPEQGIATVNELALPVDVPVRFSITSSTQMNTFYAPTLAGMIYAMPGMRSELNAVLNAPGESWGYSGNYTGAGYSHMRFKLIGVDGAGFDRWVQQAKAAGTGLATAEYLALDRPSERVPVMRFASVAEGLFDRALNQCVEPGKPCAAEVMARDQQRGGGHAHGEFGSGMPAGRAGSPSSGSSRTEPALLRDAEEKGTGPNVTAPPHPTGPGHRTPY